MRIDAPLFSNSLCYEDTSFDPLPFVSQEPDPPASAGKDGVVEGHARQEAPTALGNPQVRGGLRATAGAELRLAIPSSRRVKAWASTVPRFVGEMEN